MNKDSKTPPEVVSTPELKTEVPPMAPAGLASGNTLQRAATVLKRLKVPAPVGAGVLVAHGLTRTALVDPVDFEAKVTAWLAAPAGSK